MSGGGPGGPGGPGGSHDFDGHDPSDHPVPTNTSTCVSGCLCNYDRFVLFINASAPSPRPIYIVSTGWHLFYTRQVKHAIAQAGFTVIPNVNTTGNGIIPECAWQRLQTTKVLGVTRGSLGINNQTEGLPLPQPGLGDTVNALLTSQYPYVEITLIVTLLVGPIVVFILAGIAFRLSDTLDLAYLRWRQRKRQKSLQKPPKPKPTWPSTNKLKEGKIFNRPSNEKSRFLHLPDELQLRILAYMDYESTCSLRSTCKYYNELIDDFILKPLQAEYVKVIVAQERYKLSTCSRAFNSTLIRQFATLYCSSCKHPRPASTFALDSHRIDPDSRVCIPCNYAAGKYLEDFEVTTANNADFRCDQPSKKVRFCSVCKGLTELPRWEYTSQYTCQKCTEAVLAADALPAVLMPFEFVFSLIAWAVASSGNAPSHLWAWGTITALLWLVLLRMFYLLFPARARAATNEGFVCHRTAFVGLLALGWIGVAIGMIYEQHVVRPQGFRFYDRCSIAVIPLCIIEGILSSMSFLGRMIVSWRIRRLAKSASRVDARTLRRMLIDLHVDKRNLREDKNLGLGLPTVNPSNV